MESNMETAARRPSLWKRIVGAWNASTPHEFLGIMLAMFVIGMPITYVTMMLPGAKEWVVPIDVIWTGEILACLLVGSPVVLALLAVARGWNAYRNRFDDIV